jgi:hypothetical protein
MTSLRKLLENIDKIEKSEVKTRNFVAKNAKSVGAGKHKNIKDVDNTRKEKHKKDFLKDIHEAEKDTRVLRKIEEAYTIFKEQDDGYGYKSLSTEQIMKLIQSGNWEAVQDIVPGKHIQLRNNRNGKHTTVHVKRDVVEGGGEQLSIQQLATVSDEALDNAYGYGRSSPGNTFGWQANLKSAAYAKQMIDQGVTDIEAISDAIHKGWNVTAKSFVQNPDQFDDTEKLRAAGKLEAKLQQREKLMNIEYGQLPDDEKEKDRVVARALLQAISGKQGVAEGSDDITAAKERLAYLEKIFDSSYEYSDDHSVWKKHNEIRQEMDRLKKIIGQDVDEGTIISKDDLVDIYIKGKGKNNMPIQKKVGAKIPNGKVDSFIATVAQKYGLNPKAFVYGPSQSTKDAVSVSESDISGLLAASKLNKSFIITADLVDGGTKKFRVKAQSENTAVEKFKKHYTMAEIVSVKEEDVKEATTTMPTSPTSPTSATSATTTSATQQKPLNLQAAQQQLKIPGNPTPGSTSTGSTGANVQDMAVQAVIQKAIAGKPLDSAENNLYHSILQKANK